LLAACDVSLPQPGFLGREIDSGPTPAPVTETGGPHGALLSGGQEPMIPATRADEAVGPPLAHTLQPKERLALAEASQQAAIAERNSRIEWSAAAAKGTGGASGWVMPVSDPYRSPHGLICRDLRQAVARPQGPMVEAVSLCRQQIAGGLAIWTLERFP